MKKKSKYVSILFILISIITNVFTSCAKFEENTLFLTDPYRLLFDEGWCVYSFNVNGVEKVPAGVCYPAIFEGYDYYEHKFIYRKYKNAGENMGDGLIWVLKEKVPGISEYLFPFDYTWIITKLNSREMKMRNKKMPRDTVIIYVKLRR